ncbi:MAG TPA: inosine/xanthosine triphosphatase [Blastocatellia bacterium]|nr:inosine/xanthosine triphosphatase [Blastocatellia bacterium]
MRVALGSSRAAKIAAVRSSIERVAQIDPSWNGAEIVAIEVETDSPAMPMSDEELMRGAMARAIAARETLRNDDARADLYIGLEGGFHSIALDARRLTFLRGWAYVTDGERGSFGASPSIIVPKLIVEAVANGERELADVIDEVAGEHDLRSRQGAWGVLSRDLLTRAMSFELALVAAFAPFYNSKLYDGH